MKRSVLITNDDGVDSPGIHALADSAREVFDEVTICAPTREKSGVGQSITLHEPLRLEERSDRVFAVSGTPVDSVIIALGYLFKDSPPDLVLSGVNRGPNLGHDIFYSGTVGGAREAIIKGIPSMALSLVGRRSFPFDVLRPAVTRLLAFARDADLSPEFLLNVNIPVPGEDEANGCDAPGFAGVPGLRGVRATRLGHRAYTDEVIVREDPRKKPYFWIGGAFPKMEDVDGTDCNAIRDGFISVTPVGLDCTHDRVLRSLGALETLT